MHPDMSPTSPPSTANVRVEVVGEYLADEIVNIEKGDDYFSMIHMQRGEPR